jgi:hypothetical protein
MRSTALFLVLALAGCAHEDPEARAHRRAFFTAVGDGIGEITRAPQAPTKNPVLVDKNRRKCQSRNEAGTVVTTCEDD